MRLTMLQVHYVTDQFHYKRIIHTPPPPSGMHNHQTFTLQHTTMSLSYCTTKICLTINQDFTCDNYNALHFLLHILPFTGYFICYCLMKQSSATRNTDSSIVMKLCLLSSVLFEDHPQCGAVADVSQNSSRSETGHGLGSDCSRTS